MFRQFYKDAEKMIIKYEKEKLNYIISCIMLSLITVENLRFIITAWFFSNIQYSSIYLLIFINILFSLSFYFEKIKKKNYSRHIFSSAVILFFTKLCFLKTAYYIPKEIIVFFPMYLIIAFNNRRFIVAYFFIFIASVFFIHYEEGCLKETEFTRIIFSTGMVFTACIIYKFFSEKIDELQIESYNKLYNTTFTLLGRVSELKDEETQNHQERVGIIIEMLLQKMKKSSKYSAMITKKFIRDVINGSYLHDIGKIAIEDSILLKKGKYSQEEYESMKKHTLIGAEILSETRKESGIGIYDTALDIVKYHHEKWDGTGYPEGLKGNKIPLSARIMAVADVYDALISRRRYKKAFSHDKAYSVIVKNSSSHFDPDIVKCFKKIHEDIYDNVKKLL